MSAADTHTVLGCMFVCTLAKLQHVKRSHMASIKAQKQDFTKIKTTWQLQCLVLVNAAQANRLYSNKVLVRDHTSCQGKTLMISAEVVTGGNTFNIKKFLFKKMLLGLWCLYHSRYKLWRLTGQMCAVIRGLLAVVLSLSVRNKSPHQGYLTPMTFYKLMVSYQQNLESCWLIIINASLAICVSEPQDFHCFSCFREMEAHDLISN